MNTLVNIDEGHIGLLLNRGQEERRRSGEKDGSHMWFDLIMQCAVYLCKCLNVCAVECAPGLYLFVNAQYVFKCWPIYLKNTAKHQLKSIIISFPRPSHSLHA